MAWTDKAAAAARKRKAKFSNTMALARTRAEVGSLTAARAAVRRVSRSRGVNSAQKAMGASLIAQSRAYAKSVYDIMRGSGLSRKSAYNQAKMQARTQTDLGDFRYLSRKAFGKVK